MAQKYVSILTALTMMAITTSLTAAGSYNNCKITINIVNYAMCQSRTGVRKILFMAGPIIVQQTLASNELSLWYQREMIKIPIPNNVASTSPQTLHLTTPAANNFYASIEMALYGASPLPARPMDIIQLKSIVN